MKVYLFNLQRNERYRHPKLVRESSFNYEKDTPFNNPEEIYKLAVKVLHMNVLVEEYVYILCVDTSLVHIHGIFEVSHGSVDSSIVSPREVLIRALLCGTSSIILLHNHPSGSLIPSREDIAITERIKNACDLIGISLLDHIIIGDGYYSMKNENLF